MSALSSEEKTTTTLNGLVLAHVPNELGGLELHLCPADAAEKRVPHRESVEGRPECLSTTPPAKLPDSMVQVKLTQDPIHSGFLSGMTMQDSLTTRGLKPVDSNSADREGVDDDVLVSAFLNEESGLRVCQYTAPTPVAGTLRMWSRVTNVSEQPVELEHLSSFVISGLTPFAEDDAGGRLRLHRFRSWWSNEGLHLDEALEDIHLIRNWLGHIVTNERFGQVGTMPVRHYFPFVAIEDTEAGVFWGAQLAWAGSWQMEVTRRADVVSISGGLADYDFGHWMKSLQPGETFESPVAHIACVSGKFDDLTAKLVELQEALLPEPPESEKDMPVIFNEWCTNWGSPSHDKTLALAKRLEGSGVKYIVIDDGWAARPPEAKNQSNGDWVLDKEKFPHGMKATCDAIREMGFIPGVWFEFEVCNPGSEAFEKTDHHLQRRGKALQIGSRRFWDLNDPWVVEYLDERLIGFLKDNSFGYLKVDYNDNIGIGCDHPDSFGEGSRHQVEGIYRTFKRIKSSIPELVIENCSSGGHRLEPSMMALTSMSSFSDAHESTNIPIIARQMHYLLPPRQSQIWAVLYPSDSAERFIYSLAATFYGRMCLSGPVHDLSDEQIAIVHRSVALYQKVSAIIHTGKSHFLGESPKVWRDPVGWSGVCRVNQSADEAVVVIHTYDAAEPGPVSCDLPLEGDWSISETLVDGTTAEPAYSDGVLTLPEGNGFRGHVLYMKRS